MKHNHRNLLWSIALFFIGFYIRGVLDSYYLVTQSKEDDALAVHKFHFNTHHEDAVAIQKDDDSLPQTQQPEEDDNRTHWCVLAAKFLPKTTFGHFDHFPHAAEIILPCWSYFVKQNATKKCGFALANKSLILPPWIQELVQAMGCQVKQSQTGLPKSGIAQFIPPDDVQHIPNLYLLRPRLDYFRYLDHPEHAHMLRRLFVDDDLIAKVKGNGKLKQIGIIQRDGARRIDNLDRIHRFLVKDIPEANITMTDFKFNTVKEQATWFATKDLIIASHGAALTNSVFITPGTIVLQMYPPGYFLQTLEPLIEQSGGVAIQWYEEGANPYVKSHEINQRNHTEFEELGQLGGFSVDPADVTLRVRGALGLNRVTVSYMMKMLDYRG